MRKLISAILSFFGCQGRKSHKLGIGGVFNPPSPGTPGSVTAGATADQGSASTFALSDHVHGSPSTWAAPTHAGSHRNGGADEVATATAAANAIPKAGAGGALSAGWIPALITTANASGVNQALTAGAGYTSITGVVASFTPKGTKILISIACAIGRAAGGYVLLGYKIDSGADVPIAIDYQSGDYQQMNGMGVATVVAGTAISIQARASANDGSVTIRNSNAPVTMTIQDVL